MLSIKGYLSSDANVNSTCSGSNKKPQHMPNDPTAPRCCLNLSRNQRPRSCRLVPVFLFSCRRLLERGLQIRLQTPHLLVQRYTLQLHLMDPLILLLVLLS